MKKPFRYKNIFTYGSLQSVGHTEEYFARHTEKLLVYIVMPRVQKRHNLLRMYRRGRRVKEISVWSSGNFFLYYASWLFHYWKFLLTYFGRSEHFLVLSGHPISFFGMTIQKLLRPGIAYAFWVGDYYPAVHWTLRAYEWVKKFYHDRVPYAYYLSDTINSIMNGRVLRSAARRTVMWGMAPPPAGNRSIGRALNVLFVGVVRPSQGLEEMFSFLKGHKTVSLGIVGVCEPALYEKYKQMLKELGIASQVHFPNAFVSDEALRRMAKDYHVGVALYEKGTTTATHYTDPGKVKTYIELGLPVVMTNASAIAPYVRRFRAGEVIESPSQLPQALESMKRNYTIYQKGLLAFADHFAYEKYYKHAFTAFEKVR